MRGDIQDNTLNEIDFSRLPNARTVGRGTDRAMVLFMAAVSYPEYSSC
jgi:hypothetical protein